MIARLEKVMVAGRSGPTLFGGPPEAAERRPGFEVIRAAFLASAIGAARLDAGSALRAAAISVRSGPAVMAFSLVGPLSLLRARRSLGRGLLRAYRAASWPGPGGGALEGGSLRPQEAA